MTRLRFPALMLFAIPFLMLLSLWHLRAGSKETGSISGGSSRTPVLLELFTSEGCSSCPPADVLLQKLDKSQPVGGVDIVVLSEHVDYWDDIGWKDPYSSPQYSIRQGDYALRFGLGGPYTPQMVVDGNVQLVGSDERRAVQAIENAAKIDKIPVDLSSIRLEDNNTIALHVETGSLSPSARSGSGQVWLALADDLDQSNVRRGENAGRILKHVAVLRSLTRVGMIDRGAFSKDVKLNVANANQRNLRVVAIVQETGAGRVLGVGSGRLLN